MIKPNALPRARYTLEFKQEAVCLLKGGQSIVGVSRMLGVVDQSLLNWVYAKCESKLIGADNKPVSAEKMETARLLDSAERAVEVAIEDSEATALAYLAEANPPYATV